MIWNEFIYAIGDFFTWSFGLLRMGGNYVNALFIILIAATLIGWMVMQTRYSKEADRSGSFK